MDTFYGTLITVAHVFFFLLLRLHFLSVTIRLKTADAFLTHFIRLCKYPQAHLPLPKLFTPTQLRLTPHRLFILQYGTQQSLLIRMSMPHLTYPQFSLILQSVSLWNLMKVQRTQKWVFTPGLTAQLRQWGTETRAAHATMLLLMSPEAAS